MAESPETAALRRAFVRMHQRLLTAAGLGGEIQWNAPRLRLDDALGDGWHRLDGTDWRFLVHGGELVAAARTDRTDIRTAGLTVHRLPPPLAPAAAAGLDEEQGSELDDLSLPAGPLAADLRRIRAGAGPDDFGF